MRSELVGLPDALVVEPVPGLALVLAETGREVAAVNARLIELTCAARVGVDLRVGPSTARGLVAICHKRPLK